MMSKKIVTNLNFLYDILKIDSCNSSGKKMCSERICAELKYMGFDVKEITEFGTPIIYARYEVKTKKEILFYSHYDVKPAGMLNDWNTLPFEPFYDVEKNKIYARGSGDAKGQIFAIIEGIRRAIKRNIFYNITLVFEGEEENGSIGLSDFCKKYLTNRKYDIIMVNDSHWLYDKPVVYYGCRGQMDIKIEYEDFEMSSDYHAGNFGGIYEGAARTFVSIIETMLKELEELLDVNNTPEGGFGNAVSLTYFKSGDFNRSLIPRKAIAKIDIRYINVLIVKKVEMILDKYRRTYGIKNIILQSEDGYINMPNKALTQKIVGILNEITEVTANVVEYCGAYLPLAKLNDVCGNKYVVPLAQSDENNHAPNENISVKNIFIGIKFVERLLREE